jgi:DNA-binding XRE family transcriptional regulator
LLLFVSVLQPIIPSSIYKINKDGAKSETAGSQKGQVTMPKPQTKTGQKNLISANLVELRKRHRYSQRILAYKLQLAGYDIDKNVITRIETNKRYVTDIELKALCEVFDVSYDELIDGRRPPKRN